jgi:hypothetical protein
MMLACRSTLLPKLVTNSYKLVAEEPELMPSNELDQLYVAADYCKPERDQNF